MKASCRNLVVGQASSSGSTVLSVYPDRLEYKFHHDQHGAVQMVMWVRDIDQASLDGLVLSFHVGRPLRHFGIDYDPHRRSDQLVLEFCALEDAGEFRRIAGQILTK